MEILLFFLFFKKIKNFPGFTPLFEAKPAKLEFPNFLGEDPTVWITRAEQYFEFQVTLESQKVPLASFHLDGEDNEWWQWLRRAYKEEGKGVSWLVFAEELWAHFGPTECEDFDEALSKLKQTGSLRDYQKEFERLEWWQWLRRAYKEEGKGVSWPVFAEELWAHFGSTECEDFDEALSKLKQTGYMRDYQNEFERLGNRVQGWNPNLWAFLLVG